MLNATCTHPTEIFLIYHNHKHLYLTFRCNAFLLSLSQKYSDKVDTITSCFKWEILRPKVPITKSSSQPSPLNRLLTMLCPSLETQLRVLPVQPLPSPSFMYRGTGQTAKSTEFGLRSPHLKVLPPLLISYVPLNKLLRFYLSQLPCM